MRTFSTVVIILGFAFEILFAIACLGGGEVAPTAFGVAAFLIVTGCRLRAHGRGIGRQKASSVAAPHLSEQATSKDLAGQVAQCTVEQALAIYFEPWLQRRTAVAIFLFSDQKGWRTRITAVSRKEQTVSIELAANREVEINLKGATLSGGTGETRNCRYGDSPYTGGLLTVQFSGGMSKMVLAESSVAFALAAISAADVALWAQRCGLTRDDNARSCG